MTPANYEAYTRIINRAGAMNQNILINNLRIKPKISVLSSMLFGLPIIKVEINYKML